MIFTYILVDGEPVPEPNVLAWANWMGTHNNGIALTCVEDWSPT